MQIESTLGDITLDGFFEIPEGAAPPETPTTPPPVISAELPVPEAPTTETPAEQETTGNTWRNILLSMRDTDKLLPETLEIPEELDPAQFKSILYKAAKDEVLSTETDIEAVKEKQILDLHEKGYTKEQIEEGIRISQDIRNGYSDDSIERYETLTHLGTAELSGEQDELTVIRRMFELQGQEPVLIDALIAQHFTPKEGEEEVIAEKRAAAAKKAQTGILQIRDRERQEQEFQIQRVKEEQKLKFEKERNDVFKAIDSGVLKNVKLTKEEQEGLKKGMYEAKKQRIIQTENGPKPVYETAAQEAFRQLQSSPEGMAFLSYVVLYGAESIVSKANKAGSDQFMKAIEKEPMRQSLSDTPITPTKTVSQGAYILEI